MVLGKLQAPGQPFMPPTSKKLRGHIGLGPSIHLSVTPFVGCKTKELLELET